MYSRKLPMMGREKDGFQAESGCSILTLLGSGHHKPA